MATVTGGLGWLYLMLSGNTTSPDIATPQTSAFFSALVNVHYPLAIMCVSILTSILLSVYRPGSSTSPGIENGGMIAWIMSILLAFLYPEALIPIGIAMLGSTLAHWYNRRQITIREFRWGLWVLVPALPIVAYYILSLINSPILMTWLTQHTLPPPNVLVLLIGFGVPLLIALPGIARAIRHLEADGDRYMLLWLMAMIVGAYLPLPFGQTLFLGVTIPIAYFAARSLEDFWFQFLNRRLRRRLYILAVPFMVMSNLLVLVLPIYPIFSGNNPDQFMLPSAYIAGFEWIQTHTNSQDVILASPDVSVWSPYWTGARVVYGHPQETIHAQVQLSKVLQWYRVTQSSEGECRDLLRRLTPSDNPVRYVIYGPHERNIGTASCLQYMRFVASCDDVTIYANDR